jgi:hypothetical protein
MTEPIHPLRRWLFENQLTLAAFGAQIGVVQSALSEWMTRKKYPSPAMMLKVRSATDGAVQPNDFFPPYVRAAAKRRRAS